MAKDKDYVIVNANEEANPASKSHNIIPKILSVLLAFVLWFYVVTVESPVNEKVFKGIPIDVQVPSGGELSVYSGYNATVDITVSGKKSDLNQISAEDIKASADAGSYSTAGRYSVPVNVELPDDVTFVDKSISVLSVYLDSKTTTSVPVQVRLTEYILDDGLELASESEIEKSYSEIAVTGPKTVLDTIESARVTVPLGHVSTSMSASVDVELIASDGSVVTSPYVTKSVDSVDIYVPVFVTKDLKLKVDFKNGLLNNKNSEVKLDPPTVKVRGSKDVLDGLDEYVITTIDEKTNTADKVIIPLTLPQGVVLKDATETVEVTVTHIGTDTKTLSVSNIKVINASGIEYEFPTDTLNVTLRGDTKNIEKITEADVTLTVDMTGVKKGAGNITLPVTVTLSDTYSKTVYELGEYSMVVNIK